MLDMFENNLIHAYYPQRPEELEQVCLYDFVREYVKCGVDDYGLSMYRKRSKAFARTIYRLYDPHKGNQKEDYYYSLLLLFAPLRKKQSLCTKPCKTAKQAFLCASSANDSGIYLHQKELKQMLKSEEKVKIINNAWQQEGITNNDNYSQLDLCIVGEAKYTVKDLQDLEQKCKHKVSLGNRVAMLNADQSGVFHCGSDYVNHQH